MSKYELSIVIIAEPDTASSFLPKQIDSQPHAILDQPIRQD